MTFVVLEGGEGSGKTTAIAAAADALRATGRVVVTTREPGGTVVGAAIRSLLLDPGHELDATAESLLFAADRAHHVATVVRPALERGEVVISDRFVDSTLAYQGFAGGRDLEVLRSLSRTATGGLVPDLTVVLDVEPSVGLARARGRAAADRIESQSAEFHRRVREGFLALAAEAPARYCVIDAHRAPEVVAADVAAAVMEVSR